MAARPIGFGPAVQNFVSGGNRPTPAKSGMGTAPVPSRLEAANIIRSQAVAGGGKAHIPSRIRPTVVRGRIDTNTDRLRLSVPSRGTGRIFMFNPNDISDDKGISWGSIEIPGASHPVYQFGAGGERLISFELYIDGDRGRFGRAQARNANLEGSLSIKDELHWYRSLILPIKYGATFADVSPYITLFTFGELYNNLPCIVKKANWKVNYWVPGPTGPVPVRATISMALAEVRERSQTADEFLAEAGL